jgi:hypothetical protein
MGYNVTGAAPVPILKAHSYHRELIAQRYNFIFN